MALRDFLPVTSRTAGELDVLTSELDKEDIKSLKNLFKPLPLAIGYNSLYNLGVRSNYEVPDVDFGRISKAIDADSYAQQAFAKYQELFWKEGWTIVSENQEAKEYLLQRLDLMEAMMNKPLQEFLIEISDQIFRYHNVFLAKVRKDISPFLTKTIKTEGTPVAGYGIIPTEYIEIKRDKYNNPISYRQRLQDATLTSGFSSRREPKWKAEDVVHLYRKRKPGRLFGTPFMISVLEDIISLRQVEEDILNLVHRELFPFYVYKLGNENLIPEPEDFANAQFEIESLRTEGGLAIPGVNDIEVVSGASDSLDATGYLSHFKERVAVGLGVYPHHLGMSGNAANRSMTDRLDTMLYDKVKEYQRYFSEAIRIHVFNEILIEGGFEPIAHMGIDGISDRCEFRFNEIDVDTQVKKENHVIQKVTSNIMTIPEGRAELKMDPEMDDNETLAALTTRLQPDQIVTGPQGGTKAVSNTPSDAKKPNSQQPSTGGTPNKKNLKKGSGNIVKPTNQHGTRTSPNIRRNQSDIGFLLEIAEMLHDDGDDDILEA